MPASDATDAVHPAYSGIHHILHGLYSFSALFVSPPEILLFPWADIPRSARDPYTSHLFAWRRCGLSRILPRSSFPLSSGMAVTGEKKTNKLRVIEYFLTPLLQCVSESLRER
jgi:hypothetical protein